MHDYANLSSSSSAHIPSVGATITNATCDNHHYQKFGTGLLDTRSWFDETKDDCERKEDEQRYQEQNTRHDTKHNKHDGHRNRAIPFVAHVVAIQEAIANVRSVNVVGVAIIGRLDVNRFTVVGVIIMGIHHEC
jgi:hypothetical protein